MPPAVACSPAATGGAGVAGGGRRRVLAAAAARSAGERRGVDQGHGEEAQADGRRGRGGPGSAEDEGSLHGDEHAAGRVKTTPRPGQAPVTDPPGRRLAGVSVRAVAQLLVVEDDERIRTALIRALRERGHAVTSAAHRAGRAAAGRRGAAPTSSSSTSACPTSTAASCCGCCARCPRSRSSWPPPGTTTTASSRPSTPAPTTTCSSRSRPASWTPGSGRCCAGRPARPTPAPRRSPSATSTVDPRSRRVTLDGAAGRAVAEGVRPARLPGRAGRHRGHQARAAHRGVAAALRRRGQDRRRPPVVAAAQARRERRRAAATAHRARRRRPAGRARAVRRQITLLVAATTSIVLLAFLLPAASLVARVAEARALDAAQAQLQFAASPRSGWTSGRRSRRAVAAATGGRAHVARPLDRRARGSGRPARSATPTPPARADRRRRPTTAPALVQPVRRGRRHGRRRGVRPGRRSCAPG